MNNIEKILITGSGGFIFSNFARRLFYNRLNYELVSIDKIKKGNAIKNIYNNKSHKFYIGDITDSHFLNIIFEIEKPDIVIHGAAESSVDCSINDSNPFVNSNVLGTQKIIDTSLKWGVKKLVYMSTDEVYGALDSETDNAWNENSPLNPKNPYSATKASGELLLKAAGNTHGLNYNVIRPCNNYGPRQSVDKFIPKIIKSVLNEEEFPMYGKGAQVREWLHVYDCFSAIMKVVENGEKNETYNVSANHELSNIEVFQKICNIMEKGYNLVKFVKDRPGHDFRYAIDSSKIKTIGWQPQYKFVNGIKHCVDWYMKNQWFLRM